MAVDQIIQNVRDYRYPERSFIGKAIVNYLTSSHMMDVVDTTVIEAAARREIGYLNDRLRTALAEAGDTVADLMPRLEASAADHLFAGDVLEEALVVTGPDTQSELRHIAGLYDALTHRLTYLLDPTVTLRNMDKLDPYEDRYQLASLVLFMFKVHRKFTFSEGILAIALSESVLTFFHSTRQAEEDPLKRQTDTAKHYYYFIEWGGVESYHGSETMKSMNEIHGRYFIHNDAIKFVHEVCGIYETAALDKLDRPITEKLKRAYFNVYYDMGLAMNIQGLTQDYDTALAQLHDKMEAMAEPTEYKHRMYWSTRRSFYEQLNLSKTQRTLFNWIGNLSKFEPQRRAISQPPLTAPKRIAARTYLRVMSGLYKRVRNQAHIASLEHTAMGTIPAVTELGPDENSIPMSSGCPFAGKPNKGFPENQVPIFTTDEARPMELAEIPRSEIEKHNTIDDLWVVIDGEVYDLSSFAANHPGGQKVLLRMVGRDAKAAYDAAGHTDSTLIFALNYRIGRVAAA